MCSHSSFFQSDTWNWSTLSAVIFQFEDRCLFLPLLCPYTLFCHETTAKSIISESTVALTPPACQQPESCLCGQVLAAQTKPNAAAHQQRAPSVWLLMETPTDGLGKNMMTHCCHSKHEVTRYWVIPFYLSSHHHPPTLTSPSSVMALPSPVLMNQYASTSSSRWEGTAWIRFPAGAKGTAFLHAGSLKTVIRVCVRVCARARVLPHSVVIRSCHRSKGIAPRSNS